MEKLKKFGWKVWLGIGLLVATSVMTVVALIFPKEIGENLNYLTFISHLAIILTAMDIIGSALANEKLEGD